MRICLGVTVIPFYTHYTVGVAAIDVKHNVIKTGIYLRVEVTIQC